MHCRSIDRHCRLQNSAYWYSIFSWNGSILCRFYCCRMACNSSITETMLLLYLLKWCLGLFLTMLPCVAVMWALTVLFGFLCVAHVQNFFNQRSTDCNCWSEYHLYFGGICVVYYLCEKEGNPQCGKYYLHDCICFMIVTDCRVWRICTIFDFCKMSCFAMPINFIKFNFVK